jgi:hypothetical protein
MEGYDPLDNKYGHCSSNSSGDMEDMFNVKNNNVEHFKAQAMVAVTDPQAAALGFQLDTTKVDPKKFPKHAAAQKCGTCALFQGKLTDPVGGCPLFKGKQVAGNGWCSAWAKRG